MSSPLSLRVRWAVIGTGWALGVLSLSLWLLSYQLHLRTMPLGEMAPWRDAVIGALWAWCGRFGLGSLFLPWLIARGLERPWAADRWGGQLSGHLARAVGVLVTVAGTYWLARQVGHGLGGDAYPLSRLLHPLLEGVLVQDLTFYTAVSLGASWVGRVIEDGRLRQELAETRLSLLKTQLDPHFLFNALNSLAELTATDPARAERSILRMGDFLRTLLEADPRSLVPLATELEQLQAYLEIQKARFQDGLEFATEIEPECLEALVPTMILQPLAENSVKHGRLARRTLHLTVAARQDASLLVLDFLDDGKGPATMIRRGVGLDNCAARLKALFDDRASLTIEARAAGGTRVRLVLPLRFQPPTTTEKESA